MYKLEASSELMKNHKAAQVLSDQSSFQVLQTSQGQSLFFSIGDSKILYLSAEQDNLKTGWLPIDLTTELANNHPGQTVTAKAFAVCQGVAASNILVAQAIHVAETNADLLYILAGLSNSPDAEWLQPAANRNWIARPYDDSVHPVSQLSIAYLNIPLSQDAPKTPYLMIGLQDPATSLIQPYVVDVNPQPTGQSWNIYPSAVNSDALLDMRMGQPKDAMLPGLYELSTLNDMPSLTFTAIKGLFGGAPDVTQLSPPKGATSLSVVPTDASVFTNLYVAGTGGIWLYTAEKQANFSAGVRIIANDLLANVEYLEAHLAGSQITLWGKNNSGVVFYSRCDASKQADASAWSAPIPIQQGVDQLTTMLNLQTQSSVLYAHTAGQEIVKLTQDPVTTHWRTQSILLPQLDVGKVTEFYTYTTHVKVTDENALPLANQTISLTATSPGSVYVNDTYMTLSSTIPLQVQSDADGTVTLVQETQTLGAICYNLLQGDGSIVNVNPMNNSVQRMQDVTDGTTLGKVTVTDEHGNSSSMVPGSVSSANKEAVAQGLVQFKKTSQTLPQDGSLQSNGPSSATRAFDVEQDTTWGMSFTNGDIQYHEGMTQMAALGLKHSEGVISLKTARIEVGNVADAVEAFGGDILKWMEDSIDDVDRFFIQVVDGVNHFFIQIGKSLYHFVMKCVHDVVHAIQFILKKIEVGFEQLVQWLGFIFSFDEIRRTHKALKNIFKQYALFCANDIASYKTAIESAFANVEDAIKQWADIPEVPETAGSLSAASKKPAGSDSPQSHYGSYHAKNNAGSAVSHYTPSFNETDEVAKLLGEFLATLQQEKGTFTEAFQKLKTDVVDPIATLSTKHIVERLTAIIFDVILESVENGILMVVDIMALLVAGAVDVLDKPIDIPVLSWFFKEVSGDDLTILDLACFIVAIPVTVVCKLVTKAFPFPDNKFTRDVINAPDFAAIQSLYQHQKSLQSNRSSAAAAGPAPENILALSGAVAGYFGAIAVMGFGTVKFESPNLKPIAALYAVAYLFYVAPDITPIITAITTEKLPTWDVEMNSAVCAASVLKSLVDISLCTYQKGGSGAALTLWNSLSPAAEAFLNIVWEIPVIASLARNQSPASIVAFVGNTAFDAGGWLAPFVSYPKSQEVRHGFFVATLWCSAVYAEMMLVQGILDYYGSQDSLLPD